MNIIPLLSLSYIGKNIVLVIARQMMAPKGGAVIKIPIMTALDLPLKYTLVTLETPTDINDPPKPNKATANKSRLKFSDKDLNISDDYLYEMMLSRFRFESNSKVKDIS